MKFTSLSSHLMPVSESRASLATLRVCSFDSNDCVMLFSENKYDDDDHHHHHFIRQNYTYIKFVK